MSRTVVRILTMQGFLGDTNPYDYNLDDYRRQFYDFAVSTFTDFVIASAILRLIYVKN